MPLKVRVSKVREKTRRFTGQYKARSKLCLCIYERDGEGGGVRGVRGVKVKARGAVEGSRC